jgi:pimeloyl-ACP methyl ester carboxylesterase
MELQIRFCKTSDGIQIAYAKLGQGSPIVFCPGWVSHLQLNWETRGGQAFLEPLARSHTVVVYDRHGSGLSQRKRTDFSLESEIRPLQAVVDHLKLKRFILFGYSQGGAISVLYVTLYPRRVSHLILYDSFARGKDMFLSEELKTAYNIFAKEDWETGSKLISDAFVPAPEASDRLRQLFAEKLRECMNPDVAAPFLDFCYRLDVTDSLPKVHVPTLVMHRRGDRVVPLESGRAIAASIPGSQFIQLEGSLHPPFLGDVGSIVRAISEFLGDAIDLNPPTPEKEVGTEKGEKTREDSSAQEARGLIAKLDEVVLSKYRIIGNYTRYDEGVRNTLKDARTRIAGGCLQPSRKRENHLIWAAPGSGKTYFVQQIAASLASTIRYQELNLAKSNEQEFRAGLRELNDCKDKPCLCLIDECDAKPQEPWPYELLLPYLDASAERGIPLVFVLAGSGGAKLGEIKKRISARVKGADLLSRIPAGNEYEIMPLNIGDRILVVLSQFREVAKEFNREISSVEKFSLYYVALNPRLANARQLREFAFRAIERVPFNDDRVKYDHLFSPGDPENKAFWFQTQATASGLMNSFTTLRD